MIPPNEGAEPESLRELAARVIDNTKAYLRAELTLAKQTVATKAGQAGPAIGFVVVAIVLVQSAITVLAASLGLLLARWLGLAGGFAVSALIFLLGAALLGWMAAQRFKDIAK